MTLMAAFWILIPLFIGVLFIGLYRNLFAKLAVIFGASGRFIPLQDVDATIPAGTRTVTPAESGNSHGFARQ